MTANLKALLDNGSKRGLGYPERTVLKAALIENGLHEEAGILHRMVAFLHEDKSLSPENVLSLANVIQARADNPDSAGSIVEAIVRKAIKPGPLKKRGRKRLPVPANVDRSKMHKKFPGSTNLAALSVTQNRVLVEFIDGEGKKGMTFLKRTAAQPKFAAKRNMVAVIPKQKETTPPPPRPLTADEQWRSSPLLQGKFPSIEIFKSFTAAKLAGHVR